MSTPPDSPQVLPDEKAYYFESFHELMTLRVAEILLVSSPYDAFIMQEDGRLAERITNEYKGLNLSRPPRISWVSTAAEALDELAVKPCDVVIVMPRLDDMDPYDLCRAIKQSYPGLYVCFFAWDAGRLMESPRYMDRTAIDRTFVWGGNTDLLLAIVKNREDFLNVDNDTSLANIRVIIFVEDSPFYLSSLLPYIYKELVMQTQAVMDDSLNEKDRMLRMRTRPKIILAENYEDAERLYRRFSHYLLCVISDVRYPRNGREDPLAGVRFLRMVREEMPQLPLLMLSSESSNREKAERVNAFFIDKNSPSLHADLRYFLVHYLGFGDFIFRLPDGRVVARASNLRSMSTILHSVPDASIVHHSRCNDFSKWLMARFEMQLAAQLRPLTLDDFPSTRSVKDFLISTIRKKLKIRQKGLVSDFIREAYDPDTDFMKIGKGLLGGKARGLAFVSSLLRENNTIQERFPDCDIVVPKTVVISTEGFDSFEEANETKAFLAGTHTDDDIAGHFKKAVFPDWLAIDLKVFLKHATYPLAVRSSAILEDAHYRPSAGAYSTFMVPNNHPDAEVRLNQLIHAIKLVYASVYFEAPRLLARSTVFRPEEDKMAVIIQELKGTLNKGFFYPSISGVSQSFNFYPVSYMKPDEGVAHIAFGLGTTVVDGGAALRFSPKYPEFLPQFSSVDLVLKNSQRYFYAMEIAEDPDDTVSVCHDNIRRLEIDEALDHPAVRNVVSSYMPADGRLRDYFQKDGYPVMTFAPVLKHGMIPLGNILSEILAMGRKGMGCPVEIEFAVRFPPDARPEFSLLQIRPMMVARQELDLEITDRETSGAFCYTCKAMGSSQISPIHDIVYVKPETFDPARTRDMVLEIASANAAIGRESGKYLLIGPGRWGTADPWLGIPVKWSHITHVGTIIETTSDKLNADPSQGSHFFHNITSLGINYLGVPRDGGNFIDWDWLARLPAKSDAVFVRHVRLDHPALLKVDGRRSRAVILKQEPV